MGVAVVGFLAPNAWLRRRIQSRQADIDRGLPDALDLMVTCVEAGLGLDAAVQRVSLEIGLARPVLAEELTLTFLEVKAGVRRTDAFRRLADRTGVQDLKTLAATLNQTDIFGTSVSRALRIQAEGMRVRRMQRAEERAAVLSVKMTMPLVLCFVPALFVVLAGPAWVNIVDPILPARGSMRIEITSCRRGRAPARRRADAPASRRPQKRRRGRSGWAWPSRLAARGDWAGAFQVADALVREDPSDGDALLLRAKALRKQEMTGGGRGRPPAGWSSLQPRNPEAHAELAVLCEHSGRGAEALDHHEEAEPARARAIRAT